MARTKTQLPDDVAQPLAQLSAHVQQQQQQLEAEIYRLADIENYPVNAIARTVGVDEEVMKKRMPRIRRRYGNVQDQEAA